MADTLEDDIFKSNFVHENILTLVKISLKFVPKGPIDNECPSIGSDNGLAPNR